MCILALPYAMMNTYVLHVHGHKEAQTVTFQQIYISNYTCNKSRRISFSTALWTIFSSNIHCETSYANVWLMYMKLMFLLLSNSSTIVTDNNMGTYIIHYSIQHIAFSAKCTLSTTIVILI